ncbi:MAG: Gfo/Idh/MocA family oxidoreductase [Clostridiales bacterium]|nr:Gfo/Idh/MocA family oxidoreductase [Clostridiales bacterium]
MTSKPRIAVIGCGFFGRMHAEIFAAMRKTELACVVDVNAEAAKALALRLHTEYAVDFKTVIRRGDIDIVDVCVPDSMHTEVVLEAIQNQKHVLIEKPLADTTDNALALLEACRGYEKKVMVAHICRFDIRYERAYEAIRSGSLGEIIYIASKRNSPTLGAKRYAKHCKLITHSGVHDIDLVRWFMGCEYQSVYAVGRQVRMVKEGFENCLDSVQAIFTFQNGVTYSMENTWALPDKYPSYIDARLEIVGSKGMLSLDFGNQGYNVYTNEGCSLEDVSYWTESFGARKGDLRTELSHFVDCVLYDEEPRVSVRDGYEAAIAAAKALESVDSGKIVTIHP